MNDIIIPSRYNYAEIYLTFKCNLSCDYCVNRLCGPTVKTEELSTDRMIEGLNRLKLNGIPLTIGGGEPTVYKGFYDVVNGLRDEIKIDLLTNLQFNVNKFINNVSLNKMNRPNDPAYKSIRVSYHTKFMDPDDLLVKAVALQDAGFNIGIFGINHPESVSDNMRMSELSRKAGIYFFCKDFLGEYDGRMFGYYRYPQAVDGVKKGCMCRTKELLISPSGKVYRCHRDLYLSDSPVGDILDGEYNINDGYLVCYNYGTCNPCDAKSKTNRFLQMGNSGVDISVNAPPPPPQQ